MIDYPTAKQIVQAYLIRTFPQRHAELAIVEEWTKEKDYGWVICYPARELIETLILTEWDVNPVIVTKEDGVLHDPGETSLPYIHGANGLVSAWEALILDPRLWKVEDRDKYLGIQLALAAREGDIAKVKRLWEQGVSLDSLDPLGRTALMFATQTEEIAIVQFLLRHRANVNLPWPSGVTALCLAVSHDDHRLVKMLLKAGASVHTRDEEGQEVLHWATASWSPMSMLRCLVRAGADVNAVDDAGQTPLMIAAQQPIRYAGQNSTEYLLAKRADVSRIDSNGWTALDHALEHEGPVELLIRAGAIRGQRGA